MLNQWAKRLKVESGTSSIPSDGPVGDYQTMFVELWAYLADVLTFYQERIANEAFLQTATQSDSLLRLCRLIDYRPNPGASASALLAFTVEKDKSVLIPAGHRASNKPVPGKAPAVFETESAYMAIGQHSAIPVSATAPMNQFAALGHYKLLAVNSALSPETSKAASDIFGVAGTAYLPSFTNNSLSQLTSTLSKAASVEANVSIESSLEAHKADAFKKQLAAQTPANAFESHFVLSPKQRPVVLQGTKARLAAGDYVLIVQERDPKETVRKLDSVRIDKATHTTTIYWTEPDESSSYDRDAVLFAFRVVASPIESNLPAFATLSPTLTTVDGAPFRNANWDDATNQAFTIPKHKDLYLDTTYPGIMGANVQNGIIAIVRPGATPDVYHIKDVRQETKSRFTIMAKTTVLTLEKEIPQIYPIRTTNILAGAEPLILQDNLPLPQAMSGDTLILAGYYPRLEVGQKVVVRGKRIIDLNSMEVAETPSAEEAELAAVAADESNNLTRVVLKTAMQETYVRSGAVLMANVVNASHGETVKDEVLGSGNGSAFQSFAIKKQPVTYLPSADPEGLSTIKSTLRVTVNGVRWTERATLFESRSDAQEYTATQNETGQTEVSFGDGVFGARPPTGRDNIRARYRKGLGADGNVAADGIAQLLDNIPGLQKVVNPLPAQGGLDQERIEQIRSNAPARLRTFGQAVSIHNYADLALTFPGVWKASAAWVVYDPQTKKAVAQPYVQLTVALANHAKLSEQTSFKTRLREFLDRHRDPNVPLRVSDGTEVGIDVAVEIAVDDRFPQQATLAQVQAALNPNDTPGGSPGYFSLERLQFGQGISLSDLYHAIHAVAGVRNALVRKLQRNKLGSPDVAPADILVGPTELVVIKTLTVASVGGGFVDS